jgi:hypothetical protein
LSWPRGWPGCARKPNRPPRERTLKFAAATARLEAEVDLVKAALAYPVAHGKLMALLGKP